MTKYRDDSDPRNIWGDDDQPSESRPQPRNQWGSRQERRGTRQSSPAPARNQRPAEVSERVWGLAEHWIERGTAALGKRPPVSLQEFSKRLGDTIRQTKPFQAALRPAAAAGVPPWEHGPDYVNDLLSRMVEMFWDGLEAGESNSAALQFRFLDDTWDGLLDAAQTSLRVARLRKHGVVVERNDIPRTENPYLNHLANQRMRDYLEMALADDDGPSPVRNRTLRKPSQRNS